MRKIFLIAVLVILFFSCRFRPPLEEPTQTISPWTIILYMSIDNIQFGSFPTDLWGLTDNLLAGLGSLSKSQIPIILLYDGTKQGDSKILALHLRREINDRGAIIPKSGEVNYADPETMAKFIIWTAQHFPARHYLLGLCHHYGWKGYNTDESSPGALGMDILTLEEHARAMNWVKMAGVRIDIIWFEACSITMLESLYQYAQDARYIIGNEDTIDFYEEFTRPLRVLNALGKNPEISPEELAELLVEKTPLLTPSLLSNQFLPYSFALNPKSPGSKPKLKRMGDVWKPTQFAFSSEGIFEVKRALDELAKYLLKNLDELRPEIERARKKTKEYTLYPWYIDLWDFADRLEKSSSEQMLKILCQNLKQKIEWSIPAEKKPKSTRHYHGILIMFPLDREEFIRESQNQFEPKDSYFQLAFSRQGFWDDFLKAYFQLKETRAGDLSGQNSAQ